MIPDRLLIGIVAGSAMRYSYSVFQFSSILSFRLPEPECEPVRVWKNIRTRKAPRREPRQVCHCLANDRPLQAAILTFLHFPTPVNLHIKHQNVSSALTSHVNGSRRFQDCHSRGYSVFWHRLFHDHLIPSTSNSNNSNHQTHIATRNDHNSNLVCPSTVLLEPSWR